MDYNQMIKTASRMISDFGEDVEFKAFIDTYINEDTGIEEGSEVTVRVKGIQSNVSDFIVDYSNIKKGDKTIVIPAGYGIPTLGSEILVGSQLHRVMNVTALQPAGIPVYLEVQVRSYALTEDLDSISFRLSQLPLGTLVSDPNRLESPVWIVIGTNHYKQNQTTLMTYRLVSSDEPFKGDGRWPVSPWSETWMRRWLLNDFRNTISAKLIKNLQPFTVQTGNQRSTDTISLLSNHELGFSKSAGVDNGEPFAYFQTEGTDREAANALRIAAYENLNYSYWTREAGGVAADGTYASLNPLYGHGVRPVINLISGIEAVLNASGEYELQLP